MTRGALSRCVRAILVLPAAIAAMPGCVSKPIKAANKQPSAPSVFPPKGVEGKQISVNWMENLPNGEARPVLDIEAASGSAVTGTRSGKFNQSRGFIYREGKKALRFEAPKVDAAEEKQIVIATGRVKVWSVDPPGGTVEADRVTWYIQKNKVVAEGNVDMTFHPQDPSRPSMSLGPVKRMTIDTELKRFEVP